eukprot:gene7571-8376_t
MNENDLEVLTKEIYEIFSSHDICEVDFIPSLQPPFIICDGGAFGLAYAILKPLYTYSYKSLCHHYTEMKTLEVNSTLGEQQQLSLSSSSSSHHHQLIDRYSLVTLLIKGDLAFAYNIRKTWLKYDLFSLSKEFLLLRAIFSKHPKSPAGWDHRRWCYRQRHHLTRIMPLQDTTLFHNSILLTPTEIETEKEVCRIMGERYPRNYYAWMHRLWLLPQMTIYQLDDEIIFSEEWLRRHISDHTAAQHYLQVLTHILERKEALDHVILQLVPRYESSPIDMKRKVLLLSFWQSSRKLLTERPGHESLWSIQKGIFTLLIDDFSEEEVKTIQIEESLWALAPLLDDEVQRKDVVELPHDHKVDQQDDDATEEIVQMVDKLQAIVLGEIEFVREQLETARFADNPIWSPRDHIVAALRALLFILAIVLRKRHDPTDPAKLPYEMIVKYMENHDPVCCTTAYLSACKT